MSYRIDIIWTPGFYFSTWAFDFHYHMKNAQELHFLEGGVLSIQERGSDNVDFVLDLDMADF